MDRFHAASPDASNHILLMFIIALIFLVGLTVTSKNGWDRWIYGSFTVAMLAALIHFREFPALPDWPF